MGWYVILVRCESRVRSDVTVTIRVEFDPEFSLVGSGQAGMELDRTGLDCSRNWTGQPTENMNRRVFFLLDWLIPTADLHLPFPILI
ncbi:hypothetical protein C5167_014525 [Papaver somniferum]|uniref:Uncharacterized protein n=1 Tax=Papaver somniferum TaxID=3469 RepID=A0A4Y7J6V3_PAPSO|nr:hypothetical protein C5167_014525 [Papaver somniferum]